MDEFINGSEQICALLYNKFGGIKLLAYTWLYTNNPQLNNYPPIALIRLGKLEHVKALLSS